MTPLKSPQTALIHPDYEAPSGFVAINPAIHHASTVVFENTAALRAAGMSRRDAYRYGLHGTPATYLLEEKLARLEGAKHVLLCPSGLSAVALPALALLASGDEVLVPENAYGPNRDLCENHLPQYGISTRLYDPMQQELEFRAHTKLICLEAPGSVTMEVPDLPALAQLARRAGVLSVVDNTYAAGLAFKPFEHGIDMSVQALTKFQSGGGDVLMGSVSCVDDALAARLEATHRRIGLGVSPDDAYLVHRSLPTMQLRYEASDARGRELAVWLSKQKGIARVLHPAFESCPGHANWKRSFTGAAGLFSVVFDPTIAQAKVDAFLDGLNLFKLGFSWAGAMSLAVPYGVTGMRPLTGARFEGCLVRFWIGLEDVEDLKADLRQAWPHLGA